MFNIGRAHYREVSSSVPCELGPKNNVYYREVSAIKCPLHGGFAMRVLSLFHPEKSVHCREVSAIKDVPTRRFHCI